MRHTITSADVPDDLVEAVTDAVRLCRAADGATRANDIIDGVQQMNPDLDAEKVRKAVRYAAQLLDSR